MFRHFSPYLPLIVSVFCCWQTLAQEAIDTTIQKKAENYLIFLQEAYHNGNYNLHKQYSDSLLGYAKEYNLSVMQVRALVNQAINANIKGDYQQAIRVYYEALNVCETIPEDIHNQTLVLVNLANTYNNLKLHEKAIVTMEKVLSQANKTEKPDLMQVAALNGLSKSYSLLGDESQSLIYAQKVKELGTKMGNENVILTGINHMSNSYYKLGNYEKSVQIAEEAFDYETFKTNTKTKAWILVNLGEAYYKLNNFTKAENYFNEALAIAKDHKIAEIEKACYQKLIDVYKQIGNTAAMNEVEHLYTNAEIHLLNNQKTALKEDLNTEIQNKQQTIANQKEKVALLNNSKKNIIVIGVVLVLFLGGIAWVYAKRNKRINIEKNSLEEKLSSYLQETKKDTLNLEKYKNSSLSEVDRNLYKEKIIQLINEQKPYLNQNFSQSDFAKMLKISSHHLSEILHFEFQQNFYGFINDYRIDYAKRLLENSKNTDSKMLAIAYEAGFQSKTTFYRVFKNRTGETPLEYRKRISS